MSTKTQTKGKKGSNPLYIGLAVLVVVIVAVVLFLVLGGGSSGNVCSTTIRNELFLYFEDEPINVSNSKIIATANDLGVPVDDFGFFPNTVTPSQLAKVIEKIVKTEGKGVYGLAVATTENTILGFGKGSGGVELVKIPENQFPRPRSAADFTLVPGNILAAVTYTSEKCPTEVINLAGGKAPPVVAFPSGGSQAPTGTPAP